MAIVSENFALVVFLAVIIIALVVAWAMGSHEYYESTRFNTFIAILAGLGIIVTMMFYFNLITLQNQQQELAALGELARINDSVLNSVLDSIKVSSGLIPNFVLSITPLTNEICCSTGPTGPTGCDISVGPDPVTPETCTQKMLLSYRIFALWQDVITSNRIIKFDATAYVSNFLQRANSPQLYVQWTAAKINFDANTQTFGDLLFKYASPITIQTPEEYSSVAANLIANPQFQEIVNK